MTLTPAQRRALTMCDHTPTRVVMPGQKVERTEIAYTTWLQLNQRAYVNTVIRLDMPPYTQAFVIATKAGRAELNRPVLEEPRFLRAHYGGRHPQAYTDRYDMAVRDEPEPVPDSFERELVVRNEQNRRIGYQRAHEIQAELNELNAALERLAARGDLGEHAMKRVSEMRRQRDKLLKDLAA